MGDETAGAYGGALKVGFVGLGGLGLTEAQQMAENVDNAVVTAGADPVPEAREKFTAAFQQYDTEAVAYESLNEMQEHEDLDGVVIVSPHTFHYEQGKDALEAGLDVYMEKPLTIEAADGRDLVQTARDNSRTLAVGHQRRFTEPYQRFKDIIDNELGEVTEVRAYQGDNHLSEVQDSWRDTYALSGGGQLIDSGSHLLDAVFYTLDADLREVTDASLTYYGDEVEADAYIEARLERDGETVPVTYDISGTDPMWTQRISVLGTDGKAVLQEVDGEGMEKQVRIKSYGTGPDQKTIAPLTEWGPINETAVKLQDWVDAATNGFDPAVTGEDGLKVIDAIDAAKDLTGARPDLANE